MNGTATLVRSIKNERRQGVGNTNLWFKDLTVGEARALNEAARGSCAIEATSEVGEEA